jgi:hypothetical protein
MQTSDFLLSAKPSLHPNFMKRKIIHIAALCAVALTPVTLQAEATKAAEVAPTPRYLNTVPTVLDLTAPERSGLLILKNTTAQPNSQGILHTFEIKLPAYEKALYFGSDTKGNTGGVIPSNRSHLWVVDQQNRQLNSPNLKTGAGQFGNPPTEDGVFTVFKLNDSRYLAVLPLVGTSSIGYFNFTVGRAPRFQLASFGTGPVTGDLPLLSYAASTNLYDACQLAWKQAVQSGLPGIIAKLREEKTHPEYFRYLGWCTWEEYRSEISAKLLSQSVEKIRASQLPIRWVLADEGTQWHTAASEKDRMKEGRLRSFAPRPDKFPEGLAAVTALKNPADIRWMGIWHHQGGFYKGIDRAAFADKPEAQKHFGPQPSRQIKPLPDYDSQAYFFDRLFQSTKEAGFDFVKVDFQGPNFQGYVGGTNAVEARANANHALEDYCRKHDLGLIHCFAQDIICAFNAAHATVIRVSQDYRSGKLTPARIQTYQCYNNKLWLGQVFWGDHDMFHSADPVANRLMAVSKAMSGGPVYLSDAPENFVPGVITPLCYADGEIIRPIAPALPLPESVFNDPLNKLDLYRVIAPLPNGAASIVCYNLHDRDDNATVSGEISAADYSFASALIQPYPGPWAQPQEGLVAYSHFEGKLHTLDKPLPVSLTGLSDLLVHLLSVRHGWALIGLTDKFLAPATVLDPTFNADSVTFRVREPGTFALYLKTGNPTAKGLIFEAKGNGLWVTQIPTALAAQLLHITRN